jgi:hypothetical protein
MTISLRNVVSVLSLAALAVATGCSVAPVDVGRVHGEHPTGAAERGNPDLRASLLLVRRHVEHDVGVRQ